VIEYFPFRQIPRMIENDVILTCNGLIIHGTMIVKKNVVRVKHRIWHVSPQAERKRGKLLFLIIQNMAKNRIVCQ
jgi:hypothetical protein